MTSSTVNPYTLQVAIEREGVKSFKSMLQCLDRFGKELFLEANEREVTLRTLNAAQSAFIICTLRRDFFSTYTTATPVISASVKLHLKNVTSIFKTIAGVDKVWLQVAAGDDDGADAYMRVQLQCSSGLRKKFDLSFQEVTSMNAVYDTSVCPHRLCADPARVIDYLKNFPPTMSEVGLVAAADALTLQNEVEASAEPEEGAERLVSTKARLQPSELQEYHLDPSTPPKGVAIAFSLREFKAVLTLLKELDLLLTVHIEAPGRPVIFGTRARNHSRGELPFVVECVLATVVETTSMGDDEGDIFGDDFALPVNNNGPPGPAGVGNGAAMPHGASQQSYQQASQPPPQASRSQSHYGAPTQPPYHSHSHPHPQYHSHPNPQSLYSHSSASAYAPQYAPQTFHQPGLSQPSMYMQQPPPQAAYYAPPHHTSSGHDLPPADSSGRSRAADLNAPIDAPAGSYGTPPRTPADEDADAEDPDGWPNKRARPSPGRDFGGW